MRRIPRAALVGWGVLGASLGWLGICLARRESRIWRPLYSQIPLNQGQVRTAEFEITVESKYQIGVDPYEPWQPSEHANAASRGWQWFVSSGGRTVAHGTRAPVGWYLGEFVAGTGPYVLHVIPGQGPAVPTYVFISETGGKRSQADQRLADSFSLLLAIVAANTFGAIFWVIGRRRVRQEAEAQSHSFTQPGAKGPAPQCDSAIRHPWKAGVPDISPRPWLMRSVFGIVVVLLVLLVIFMLVAPVTPKGLSVRLLRPGVEGLRLPNLEPLLIQVRHIKGSGLSLLYVNSQEITWDQLGGLLDKELRRRPLNWPVYVQGDGDLLWGDVVRAIDMVRGKRAQVILLTADPTPRGQPAR